MEQTNSNYSIIADYYSEHYNELKLYVMSRSLPADEAEDIVQNTFVRLLRGDKMITPVTLPCFVYTIAKNLIIDYYRRKHKIEEYEHFLGASDWMGRYDIDGESVFSARQINEILERGIARLTEKRSKVYRLNLFGGKDARRGGPEGPGGPGGPGGRPNFHGRPFNGGFGGGRPGGRMF